MSRAISCLLSIGCLAILTGCASSSHVIVGKVRPAVYPDQVRLYVRPPTNYEEIAILDASSRHSWKFTEQGRTDKVIARLKEQAARFGANGLLLNGIEDRYAGSVSIGSATATAYGNTAYEFGTGTSVPIRYKSAAGIAIFVPALESEEIAEAIESLKSNAPDKVKHALKELRDMNAPSTVPDILPCLKNPNVNVVRDACRTLAVLGNKDDVPAIEPLLQSPDKAVVKDANDAIAILKTK